MKKATHMNSKQPITIREAMPSDAPALLQAMNILNKETPYLVVSEQALSLNNAYMEHKINSIYNKNNQHILLALDDDKIIGVATIASEFSQQFEHVGEVGITVAKKYWGMGLGTELLKNLIELSKQSPITKRLEITVQKRNTRAISLYKRVGFTIDGVKEKAFLSENNDFIDIVMMSLLL